MKFRLCEIARYCVIFLVKQESNVRPARYFTVLFYRQNDPRLQLNLLMCYRFIKVQIMAELFWVNFYRLLFPNKRGLKIGPVKLFDS